MSVVTGGIEVAKHVVQMHGIDARGKVVVKKRLTCAEDLRFMAKLLQHEHWIWTS